jgi:hypothetical protein
LIRLSLNHEIKEKASPTFFQLGASGIRSFFVSSVFLQYFFCISSVHFVISSVFVTPLLYFFSISLVLRKKLLIPLYLLLLFLRYFFGISSVLVVFLQYFFGVGGVSSVFLWGSV